LFGKADDPASKAKVVPTENVPETQLNLTLRGVFAVHDQKEAFAIIANAGGNDEHYKVGAQIPGGVTVKEIYADHVLLSKNDRLETLRLPKKSANFDGNVKTTPPTRKGGRPGARPPRSPAGGPVSQQLQGYRDRILSNPMEAMDLVQMQPVTEAGKLKGYRLSPKRDRQLFRQAGLRPGDVVTSVNGISLSDPASMGQVMALLSTANSFNLVVERGGREENIFVDLNN
jgi:general secretion pathway protein C